VSYFVGNKGVYSRPVAMYVCPSDPSTSGQNVVRDNQGVSWGASSYACNAQVFCTINSSGVITHPQNYARLPSSFPDGTSTTIAFTEKYADCRNRNYPEGGNLWAYWFTGSDLRPYHAGFAVSWNGYSIGPGSRSQVRPNPYTGMCDPPPASPPHASGTHASMADGSVRRVSAGVSMHTWWYLCTPAGGELI